MDIIGPGAGPIENEVCRQCLPGAIFSMELVKAPANALTPSAMTKEASKIFSW